MKTTLLAACIILVSSLGAQTTTTTTFGKRNDAGNDAYGNQLYSQDVTISTQNYEVETFWDRFFDANKKNSSANIATMAKASLIVEGSSGCSIAGKGVLPAQGCSGQKPFLVNDEAVNNLNDGDTVSLIFQPTYDDKTLNKSYTNTNANVIYPMDIGRNSGYYKDEAGAPTGKTGKSFFGFFTGIFDFFFSNTIGLGNDFFGKPQMADVQYTGRSLESEDRRQRYIANIIAGVDQEHRIKKPYKGDAATSLNYPQLNTPVSLLHYAEAKKTTEAEQCKMMFLNLSPDGLMCRMMGGFGMDAWMPFFQQSSITNMEVNTITIDTENALLALAGQVTGESYQNIGGTNNDKLNFLQQMIKPMVTMMEIMKTMMFGSSKKEFVADPVEITHAFSEDKAMTLSLAVTNDGTQIDEFANFKLMAIRSTLGDEVNSCKVKKSPGMFSWSSWTDTFYEEKGSLSTNPHSNGSIDTHSEWVNWCQEANGKKGMFDYLMDWSSGGAFNPFNWMKGMWSMFTTFIFGDYSIQEFTSTVKRGLILDLKKEKFNPHEQQNSLNIRLLNVTH